MGITEGYDAFTAFSSGLEYHIYSNTGVGDPINYGSIIATTGLLEWTSSPQGARISAQKVRALAVEQMSHIAEIAIPMRNEGRTLAEIATYLNEQEYLTRKGGSWTPTQVKRVIDRASKVEGS